MMAPECVVCSQPAPDTEKHIIFGDRAIPLCGICYTLSKQLLMNLVRLRDELANRGILIGIPTNGRKAS